MSQKCFANVNEAPMLLKSCFVIMSLSCWAKWEIYICIGVSPSIISHGGFFRIYLQQYAFFSQYLMG